MNKISINYTLKYELLFAPNYKWTSHGKCFNIKTGRQIKQVYNKGCIGYSICGKFYSLKRLRKLLTKIENVAGKMGKLLEPILGYILCSECGFACSQPNAKYVGVRGKIPLLKKFSLLSYEL